MKKDLSVIIVSYNTKDLTLTCLQKVLKSASLSQLNFEIIVVDNSSTDGTWEALESLASQTSFVRLLKNTQNEGFGRANNKGLAVAKGRYVLYLNSDVLVPETPFIGTLIAEMDSSMLIGGLTVAVSLKNGDTDPASHRGFPTVWRSFCYMSGLERLTSRIPVLNTLFGGYHLTSLSLRTKHEIDTPTGAFYLVKKDILDALLGFDEDFFMYGEDIDLSYRIKRLGYSIIYDPTYEVIHLKNQSGIQKKNNREVQTKTKRYFYGAMAIFYKKHYEKVYPNWISQLVYAAINKKTKML